MEQPRRPYRTVGCKAGDLHMTTGLIFLVFLLLHKTKASNTLYKKTESSRVDDRIFTCNTKTSKLSPCSWPERSENWVWVFYSSEKNPKILVLGSHGGEKQRGLFFPSFILHSSLFKHTFWPDLPLSPYTHPHTSNSSSKRKLSCFVPLDTFLFYESVFSNKKILFFFFPNTSSNIHLSFHCRPYI